jgi:hypothetical protein
MATSAPGDQDPIGRGGAEVSLRTAEKEELLELFRDFPDAVLAMTAEFWLGIRLDP